jgi:diguanylate cyclase (GGDEF)-like protein
MKNNFFKKITEFPAWYVIPFSILLSEILTTIFSTIASKLMWNRVPEEVLIIGYIDAFVVSLIVVSIILYFLKKITGLTRLNEKLQDEIAERKRAEDALHKAHSELELKVLERTSELSESNRLLEEEMSERQRYEEQISHMAYYDGLTGLPNRALFEECLKQRLLMNERQKAKTAVMFIDVDDFKRVNDTLGHSYGDKLLKKIAERLNSNTRKSDSITRHRENDMYSRRGGDEFTVMLSVIKEFEDAAVVAGRIIHAMSDPFMLDGREILVTVSIGIAIYPDDGEDVDTILKNADAAMYDAKERGKNNYQYYRHSMNATTLERLNIEGDIKKALERGEFILHYQPQVDTLTRKVVGVEALIRWKHPEKGMVSPLDFIPVAEQTGLIIPISDWVVETACRQNRIWQEEGVADIPVSVNLTSHQFQQKNFIKNLIDLLEKTGLPPQSLHLEITESTLMKNTEMSFVNLYELSHLGLSMIIDDFGTGYSSLSYLKRFPIHAIKIDRSFVKDINTSADDAAIASAIISMAHTMNIKVVAEGVETEEQLTFLQERGCDEIQGYLFSRPLPADEITTYLVKEKKGEKGKTTIIK